MPFLGGLQQRLLGGLEALVSNGSTTFSPIDLQPNAWFRSDLGISTTSGNVNSWADQSGNSNAVTQSNTSHQPVYNLTGGVNGCPRITWTGEQNSFALQNTNPIGSLTAVCDYFIVATKTTNNPSNGNYLFDGASNQNEIQVLAASNNVLSGYNGDLLQTAAVTLNQPFIAEYCNNGTSASFIALNGTQTTGTLGSNGTLTYLTIGNYGQYLSTPLGWVGDIYEVIVFNYQLSALERVQVLNYLSARYGIAL